MVSHKELLHLLHWVISHQELLHLLHWVISQQELLHLLHWVVSHQELLHLLHWVVSHQELLHLFHWEVLSIPTGSLSANSHAKIISVDPVFSLFRNDLPRLLRWLFSSLLLSADMVVMYECGSFCVL